MLNLRVPVFMTKLFMGYLSKQSGCIVNLSSIAATRPEPNLLGFSMSKAGLEMFTKTSAMELAPKKVRVNCVAPSHIQDDLQMYSNCNPNDNLKRVANNTPLRTSAVVDHPDSNDNQKQRAPFALEIVRAIVFLTSYQ